MDKLTDSDTENERDKCRLENKAGFKELPDGKNFLYNNGTRSRFKKTS
jgi:hypothetical protein